MTNRDDDCGQRRLRDWLYAELDLEQPATVPSALLLLARGTVVTSQSLATFKKWLNILSPAFAAI